MSYHSNCHDRNVCALVVPCDGSEATIGTDGLGRRRSIKEGCNNFGPSNRANCDDPICDLADADLQRQDSSSSDISTF